MTNAQKGPDVVANIPVNYDESKVGTYVLPDPLTFLGGKEVKTIAEWNEKRRPQILSLFEQFQFGKVPAGRRRLNYDVVEKGSAFGGHAIRQQVVIYFTGDTLRQKMNLLIYTPADAKEPVPVFLNIGFFPNVFTVDDPGVRPGYMWNKAHQKVPAERSGGFEGRGMDVQKFLSQGIGFATVYYGDIEPDFPGGIQYGIRSLYMTKGAASVADDEWGAISAWSYGLSYIMDYLETYSAVDAKRVALFGVSRLGKTVLWTGARDPRFSLVIASCSGEGGAAISRRWYGETIAHMTDSTRYFYQFAANWAKYKDDPSKSPVDANMLVSLIAPRPLLLQTGDIDYWSDPKGEFLAAVAATPVYELFGKQGLDAVQAMPLAREPILHDLGYYMHSGGHGALPEDYDIFVKFIKTHFFDKKCLTQIQR